MLLLVINKKTFSFGIGAAMAVMGFIIFLSHKLVYHEILKEVLSLTPTSTSFKFFKESLPISFDVYFFNWTNPEDIGDPTKKPNLVELGPYSFSLKVEKINATFHENNTVSYHTKKTWTFNKSKSKGSLQDRVIQLNTVAVTAGHKIRFWDDALQQIASSQLDDHSNNISITKTVEELLFKGFADSFMEMSRASGLDENPAPFDYFAWFYMRNGSTEFDGYSNVATGVGNLDDLGKIKQWNNKATTDFFSSPHNFVEGAGDYLFPPYRTKESIKFFNVDLCQTISNEFEGEINEKGINGYKFHMDQKTLGDNTEQCYARQPPAPVQQTTDEVVYDDQMDGDLDNSTQVDDFVPEWDEDSLNLNETEDNEGSALYDESSDAENVNLTDTAATSNEDIYVDDLTTLRPEDGRVFENTENNPCHCNGECSPVGLINVTACRYGVPIFMSLPHFYHGDPILKDAVHGLNPREEDHDFYFVVEPTTGITLDVAIRLQVNIMLRSSKQVRILKDTPEKIFFPMFWFEARAGLPDDKVLMVQLLSHLPTIMLCFGSAMILFGFLILLDFTMFLKIKNQFQAKKLQKLKNKKIKTINKILGFEAKLTEPKEIKLPV